MAARPGGGDVTVRNLGDGPMVWVPRSMRPIGGWDGLWRIDRVPGRAGWFRPLRGLDGGRLWLRGPVVAS